MLQDIFPHQFNNAYVERRDPQPTDQVVVYRKRHVWFKSGQTLPQIQDVPADWRTTRGALIYLFSLDQTAFYLRLAPDLLPTNWVETDAQIFRSLAPQWLGFAGTVAVHLANWYAQNQFCGVCGHPLAPDTIERAMVCAHCGHKVYPRISPAIIVGVTDGDRLLLTRFLVGYKKRTLISGYTEIGETLEDTVRREVREEVGLSVTNIRYFGSQPWGMSGSLLAGFFADLDQHAALQVEQDELAGAKWYDRDQLPHDDTTRSIAWTMIEAFRHGQER